MVLLPRTPSPVFPCPGLSGEGVELWIKDDGQLHARYGGNKVRKLARILDDARERGKQRVVTLGAAGSHHVLTTALFAPDFGLRVAALLGPQPYSEHARAVLAATLAQGIEVVPLTNFASLPLALARTWRASDYFIGPGGSGLLGTMAYADAVAELGAQIRAGAMPMPDAIVVAVGSGGTAAGLVAGVVAQGLPTRVVGVQVVSGHVSRALVLTLAARALWRRGRRASFSLPFDLTRAELGRGYGFATQAGSVARERAQRFGVALEPTYTEKAFAHALELASAPSKRRRVILYWHTLSAVLPDIPDENVENSLGASFERLLRR